MTERCIATFAITLTRSTLSALLLKITIAVTLSLWELGGLLIHGYTNTGAGAVGTTSSLAIVLVLPSSPIPPPCAVEGISA